MGSDLEGSTVGMISHNEAIVPLENITGCHTMEAPFPKHLPVCS